MSESPKAPRPEVQPAEPVIPSRAPRARVSSHLRHLLTISATSASLACWPLACDPIPSPAACREKGSVLGSIEAVVTSAGAQVEVGIWLRTDVQGAFSVHLTRTSVTGGSSNSGTPIASGNLILEQVTPASPSAVVQLTYSATCEGSAAKGVRVTLTPRVGDGGTTDGGATDGGTPATYDVSVTEV